MQVPDKWIADSLPLRFARALYDAWPKSLAGRFCAAVARSWKSSRACALWERMMSGPCSTEGSRYDGAVAACHRALRGFGAGVRKSARTSVACGLIARLGRAAGRLAEKSRILSFLRALGLRRMLIIAFVLYLPLDWLIRSVIGIEWLASVWDEAFLMFALGYCLWRRAFCRVPLRTSVTPLDGPLLVYIALGVALALNVGASLSVAVAGWRAVFQYMLWFFVLIRLFERDEDFECFCRTLSVMAVVLALHGVYQFVIGVPMPAGWTSSLEMGVRTRVYSITTSCNIFACLLVMCAPLIASYAYSVRRLWQKTLIWLGVGAVCLALLFTFCRGAWLAMMAAVFVFALLTDRRILAVVLGCVPAVLLVPSVANRILFLFTSDFAAASNTAGRAMRWETGLRLFRENLLGGFGLGRFGGAVAMQNQTEPMTYFYLDNYYLKVMAEEGLFGILLFALVLGAILYTGLRGHRRALQTGFVPAARSAALLAGLVGVMVHMYTENILEVPYMNAYFWGLAAALCYVTFVREKKPDLLKKHRPPTADLLK